MKRRPTRELLDDDSGSPQEVAASLKDLRWFNRWFGGISTSRRLVEDVVGATGKNHFSLLEVASGEGYVPRLLQYEFESRGINLQVTLMDRVPSHLPKNGTIPKLAGDALRLPFHDSSYDLVSSSLFLHHLSPAGAVSFAREALRVCRVGVLVHDLIRHPLHLALAYAGLPLYRSRLTRNDAPASVWQAYTVEETRSFFQQAGVKSIDTQENFLFRMGVIAWKQRANGS